MAPDPFQSQQNALLKRTTIAAAALALLAPIASLHGAEPRGPGFRKNVGDYSLYLAVMPAEVIRGPLASRDPAASPYQPPAARDTHHVMVSIFEAPKRGADKRRKASE